MLKNKPLVILPEFEPVSYTASQGHTVEALKNESGAGHKTRARILYRRMPSLVIRDL